VPAPVLTEVDILEAPHGLQKFQTEQVPSPTGGGKEKTVGDKPQIGELFFRFETNLEAS
jgi:hypothetical protein